MMRSTLTYSFLVASVFAAEGAAQAKEPPRAPGSTGPAAASTGVPSDAKGAPSGAKGPPSDTKTPAVPSRAAAPPEPESAPSGAPRFQIGAGILGGGGIVAIEKPSDNPSGAPGSATNPDGRESYPGFFGPKVGGGVSIEGRAFGAIGLEVEFLRLTETGNADFNGAKISIEQTTWHIPMYVKGILPFGAVRPFIGIGPEIVFSEPNYVLFGGMIGAEGHIPIGKKFAISIPFSLRYAYDFGLGDKYADRYLNVKVLGVALPKPEFQHNALLTLGVSFHYSL